MRDLVKFLVFLFYCILIFFIDNYILLAIFLVINLLLAIIHKISLIYLLKNMLKFMPFVLITLIVNIIFGYVKEGFQISFQLLLVCNITYIFSQRFSPIRLGKVVEHILFPLKLFKVNTKDIGLIICISVSFIPILKKDLFEIKNAINSKGTILKLRNINLFFKPFFVSFFQKINDMEKALHSKSYN